MAHTYDAHANVKRLEDASTSPFLAVHTAFFAQGAAPAREGSPFEHHDAARDADPATRVFGDIPRCAVLPFSDALRQLARTGIAKLLVRDEYVAALADIHAYAVGGPHPCQIISREDGYEPLQHYDEDEIEEGDDEAEEDAADMEEDTRTEPAQKTGDDSGEIVHNPFLAASSLQVPYRNDGVILMGSPGIGKTLWLFFVLVLRMLAGKTTVLQCERARYYISSPEGAFEVSAPFRRALDVTLPEDAWCLVDSNSDLGDVPTHITRLRRFTVQAPQQLKAATDWGWHGGRQVPHYFMKPWTTNEILAGRDLQAAGAVQSELALEEFTETYGGSAQRVYTFASDASAYDRTLCAALSRGIPDFAALKRMSHCIASLCEEDEVQYNVDVELMHRIFLLRPRRVRGKFQTGFPDRDHVAGLLNEHNMRIPHARPGGAIWDML